ncbi:MAG: DUF3108 domain-containing protein [Pseudomonadota bacterium]
MDQVERIERVEGGVPAAGAGAGAGGLDGRARAPRTLFRGLAATALGVAIVVAALASPVHGALASSTTPPVGAPTATPPAVGVPGTTRANPLRPHVVTYRVNFKGMAGGVLVLSLKQDPASDGWIYETNAKPSFLARLVVSANSTERGWFDLTPEGVRPKRYLLEDGTRETKRDADLQYDWGAGRVRGSARGGPLDLPLEPRTQDAMSIRAALIADLQAGREPGTIPMVDGRELKHFVYRREGTAKIPTALGELDTVIYTSTRRGADSRARTWKYWFAPSLGYVPVRIEQREGSEARLTFAIREVDWR